MSCTQENTTFLTLFRHLFFVFCGGGQRKDGSVGRGYYYGMCEPSFVVERKNKGSEDRGGGALIRCPDCRKLLSRASSKRVTGSR